MPTKEAPAPKIKKPVKKDYIYAVGRRKTAAARTRLFLKKGPIVVNGKPVEEYFPGFAAKTMYEMPFKLTETLDKFSASIKVQGSGKQSQLGAVVHGLARALVVHDEAHKQALREHDLLTRDSRVKERRKVGTGGKARRQKQSPKR